MLFLILLSCTAARSDAPTEEAPVAADACPLPSLTGQFTLTRWPGSDAVGPDGERPMPMSKDYTFTDTTYTMEGYPSLTITGGYTVLSAEEGRLQVRFTDTIFDGSPQSDQTLWIEFSDCNQTMVMEGMTYRRVE